MLRRVSAELREISDEIRVTERPMAAAVNARRGVLLVNLGSPDAPTPRAVRRYLREFLGDPRVLDMSNLGRWLLLNAVILPTRPRRSAAAYQKIWTPNGSPLITHGISLRDGLRKALGDDWVVELAMRYGVPSIEAAIAKLADADAEPITVVPLFPQYASASTGSALEAIYCAAAERWNTPSLDVLPPFYDEPGFIASVAAVAREIPEELLPDHVLMSFHGLPERQIRKSDATGAHCFASGILLRRGRAREPLLLPGAVRRDRPGRRARAQARPRRLDALVPVASRPHALDQAVHRRGAAGTRRPRHPAPRRRVPVLRRRLPRNDRGDRSARSGTMARARRRGARAGPVRERTPDLGRDAGGVDTEWPESWLGALGRRHAAASRLGNLAAALDPVAPAEYDMANARARDPLGHRASRSART